MTFRIDCLDEDFSGLTQIDFSTLRVENRYLILIQAYTYRQRVKNASHYCIKLENLRFTFMRTLSTISNGSEYPFEHELTVFGAKTYNRTKGKSNEYLESFEYCALIGVGKIIVYSGDVDKKTKVKSAEIVFNKKKC